VDDDWTMVLEAPNGGTGAGSGILLERFAQVNDANKLQSFAVFEPSLRQVGSLLIRYEQRER
jgi:hypothetical protein